MPTYAQGGYIPACTPGDDSIPALLSEGCFVAWPPPQPAELDDDECVVKARPDGWHCVRSLHAVQPCQSPSPAR